MIHLRINGVSRDFKSPDVVIVYTNKCFSDGELKVIRDLLVNHFNVNGISDQIMAPVVPYHGRPEQ